MTVIIGKMMATNILSVTVYDVINALSHDNGFSYLFAESPTALAIFGPDQDNDLELFLEQYKGVVVYVSPKCVNLGYDTPPRNTVVIFEDSTSKIPDCRASNLRTVSTV
jgi:hypothetical protein